MIKKVGTAIEQFGKNTLVYKSFVRNNQYINTTSAYIDNKLFHRTWDIVEVGKRKILKQSYNANIPIPKSRTCLDIKA